MGSFKCRCIIPHHSARLSEDWTEILEGSPEEAALEFHSKFSHEFGLKHRVEENNKVYFVNFARIEVEGFGSFVTRIYHYGIWRRGGVKRTLSKIETLEGIAATLKYDDDPNTLLAPGWMYEEEDK